MSPWWVVQEDAGGSQWKVFFPPLSFKKMVLSNAVFPYDQ